MTTEATVEEQQQMVGEFLEGLAGSFGIDATAEHVSADDDSFEVNLAGDNAALGLLIGPKGNHLVALHEVTKTMLQRRLPGADRARIRVDVGGYRQKRRQALEAYVRELAATVMESDVEKGLEPMNAADRKVVHDTVNEIDGVDTVSVGDEPRRRVVITRAGD
ncbi:MAG: R3H domain-containing nucleic acid-binding protein [Actinomycetota bacterium]|nr:R3H domain-containing nucleic acid-binding protein [Actinomycetota bacterium]